ncbi:MAG TPA: 2-amino-4-hydroxy-6-hydroxymethyldihydropteridine diphosphokinase [Cryptosporangiaceae bacterium]|nr:2-amino-4-hydroxy-6-hydroxymethyldihydropteridine diphosphokinase [Cryptosporangiaceae bacterium]
MSRAVLSVGSNLGDRLGYLADVLAALPGARTSGVYETAPWGPVPQGDYLNAVLVADDPGRDAAGWLAFAHERERAAGRVRGARWGPRTLDVDVIQVHDAGAVVRSAGPTLVLPHPRAHERAFVLVPWAEVEPDAVLDGHGRVVEVLARLDPAERAAVRRRDDLAFATGRESSVRGGPVQSVRGSRLPAPRSPR